MCGLGARTATRHPTRRCRRPRTRGRGAYKAKSVMKSVRWARARRGHTWAMGGVVPPLLLAYVVVSCDVKKEAAISVSLHFGRPAELCVKTVRLHNGALHPDRRASRTAVPLSLVARLSGTGCLFFGGCSVLSSAVPLLGDCVVCPAAAPTAQPHRRQGHIRTSSSRRDTHDVTSRHDARAPRARRESGEARAGARRTYTKPARPANYIGKNM